jgi:hypothetical protein
MFRVDPKRLCASRFSSGEVVSRNPREYWERRARGIKDQGAEADMESPSRRLDLQRVSKEI